MRSELDEQKLYEQQDLRGADGAALLGLSSSLRVVLERDRVAVFEGALIEKEHLSRPFEGHAIRCAMEVMC